MRVLICFWETIKGTVQLKQRWVETGTWLSIDPFLKNKMSCRQVLFSGPKWTLSKEAHKRFQHP